MKNSKFVNLLQYLSAEEIRQFNKFLGKYYQQETQPIKLYQYIKKNKLRKLSYEGASLSIFGEEAVLGTKRKEIKRKYIVNILSRLSDVLDDFLALQYLNRNRLTKDFILSQDYKERGANSLFQNKANTLKAKLSEKEDLMSKWYSLQLTQDISYTESVIRKKNNINEAMHKLDILYARAKLKLACEIENRSTILGENYEILFIEEILQKEDLLVNKDKEDIFYKVYNYAYRVIKFRDETAFKMLMNILKDESLIEKLSIVDQKIIYTYLLNYCYSQIQKSDSKYFLAKVFYLHKFALEKGFLINDNTISSIKYINVVTLASMLGEYEWAKSFMKEYKELLPSDVREDSYYLSLAQIEFSRKKFDSVLGHLNKVRNQNVPFYLQKNLIMLSYFYEVEKDNSELIIQNCTRFDAYLNNHNSLSEVIKTSYKSFTKFIRIFVKRKKSKEELLRLLEKQKYISYRSWLREKIEEL